MQMAFEDKEAIVVGTKQRSIQLQLYVNLHQSSTFFFFFFFFFSSHFYYLSSSLLSFFIRPNGLIFTVPPENIQISTRISVGDVVTFSYENRPQSPLPVNPVIIRLRTDVSWKDILHLHFKEQRHGMKDEKRKNKKREKEGQHHRKSLLFFFF